MKKLIGILAIPLAWAGAGCAAAPVDPEAQARQERLWQAHHDAAVAAARAGRLPEAEKEFLAAIGSITTLPGNQARLVRSLNPLGVLYQAGGKRDAAESVLRKALEFAEKALGPEDPETLATRRNLARALGAGGKLAEAESLLAGIAEPTGADLEDLGAVQAALGKREADETWARALAAYEKSLEPVDLATRLDALARAYASRGNAAKAVELLERALGIFEKALGPDHPNVAACLQNLAGVRAARGEGAEAKALYRRSADLWEKKFGKEHPATVACRQREGLIR